MRRYNSYICLSILKDNKRVVYENDEVLEETITIIYTKGIIKKKVVFIDREVFAKEIKAYFRYSMVYLKRIKNDANLE